MRKINWILLARIFYILILALCLTLLILVDLLMDDKTFCNVAMYVAAILVCLIIGSIILNEIEVNTDIPEEENK